MEEESTGSDSEEEIVQEHEESLEEAVKERLEEQVEALEVFEDMPQDVRRQLIQQVHMGFAQIESRRSGPSFPKGLDGSHISAIIESANKDEERALKVNLRHLDLAEKEMEYIHLRSENFLKFGVFFLAFVGAVFFYQPALTADLVKVLGGAIIGAVGSNLSSIMKTSSSRQDSEEE